MHKRFLKFPLFGDLIVKATVSRMCMIMANLTRAGVSIIDTIKISNVEVPKLPPALDGNFDVDNWFKVYVNGLFIPAEKYSYYVSSSANQVEFNFSTGCIQNRNTCGLILKVE